MNYEFGKQYCHCELDDEMEAETDPCPYCGIEIYEDSEICPYCGSYIIMEEGRPAYPAWVFWTALILLALILGGFTCLL